MINSVIALIIFKLIEKFMDSSYFKNLLSNIFKSKPNSDNKVIPPPKDKHLGNGKTTKS